MDLKKYFITYDTREEAINIANGLVGLGYEVFDLNGVGDPDWHNWKGFYPTKGYFVQSRSDNDFENLDYEDFMKIVNKKRVKNTKIDPFNEEDWGFEKESENENFSHTSKRHIHRFPL